MDDLQERITRAANRTWQAIGSDILVEAAVDSITREEVVEAVVDYIRDFGQDKDAVAEFERLGFEQKQAMLLEAFPLAHYGW